MHRAPPHRAARSQYIRRVRFLSAGPTANTRFRLDRYVQGVSSRVLDSTVGCWADEGVRPVPRLPSTTSVVHVASKLEHHTAKPGHRVSPSSAQEGEGGTSVLPRPPRYAPKIYFTYIIVGLGWHRRCQTMNVYWLGNEAVKHVNHCVS